MDNKIMDEEMEKKRKILDNNKHLFNYPGINSIGINSKGFHVTFEKMNRYFNRVPIELEGYPVVVEVIGKIRAL